MLQVRDFINTAIPSMTTTAVSRIKRTDRCVRAGNAVKGAPLLAFILTLDGVSRAQNRTGLEAKRLGF